MKDILESEATFDAYAKIDYGHFRLKLLQERMDKPRSPIELAIDMASGFDKQREKDFIKETIDIITDMIEAKKIIEVDYSKDQEILDKSKLALKNLTA